MDRAGAIFFVIGVVVLAVIFGSLAGVGAYYLRNVETLVRIETLEKTCRAVN